MGTQGYNGESRFQVGDLVRRRYNLLGIHTEDLPIGVVIEVRSTTESEWFCKVSFQNQDIIYVHESNLIEVRCN